MAEPNQGFSVSVYIRPENKEKFKIFKKLLVRDPMITDMNLKNPRKVVSAFFNKIMENYVARKSAEVVEKEEVPENALE